MSKRWAELTVFILTLAVVSLALSCGGGGGSSGGGVAVTLAITEDNVNAVAGAAAGSTVSLLVSGQEAPVDKPGAAAASDFSLIGLVEDLLERYAKGDTVTGESFSATYEEVVYYADGGTATIMLSDVDDSRDLSTGDRITAVYDQAQAFDRYIDGAISMFIDYLVRIEDTGYISVRSTVSLANLHVGYVDQARELDGICALTMQITPATGAVKTVIQGTTLDVIEGVVEWKLLNFRLDYTSSTQTNSYRYSSSGGIESAEIGGTVTYRTAIAFEGTRHAYPDTGSMVVLGTERSKLTIAAVDDIWAGITLDEDGDGTFEYENELTWEELLAGD